jgi:hypothetical protein
MAYFLYGTGGRPVSENLSSQIDGFTATFTSTINYDRDTLHVYYNGQRQFEGITVTILSNNSFRLSFVPLVGTYVFIDFFKE